MVDKFDTSTKFSAKNIRAAIHALESNLGRATVDAMIYDLENYGLPLVNERTEYTLVEIQAALEKVFGIEATPMLFERVKKSLLENTRKHTTELA